jgi:predicted AAA+ superfamily ATPase
MKQITWSDEGYTLHHYRDKDQDEIDIVVEDEHGALVGVEVKASATVHASDFKGIKKLLDICGDDLKLGIVMYDGTKVVPFGDRLFAAPISCLWARRLHVMELAKSKLLTGKQLETGKTGSDAFVSCV